VSKWRNHDVNDDSPFSAMSFFIVSWKSLIRSPTIEMLSRRLSVL